MIKLKPCPFCGGEAYNKSSELYVNHKDDCFISMYPLNYDEFGRMETDTINQIFINAWNRRVNND